MSLYDFKIHNPIWHQWRKSISNLNTHYLDNIYNCSQHAAADDNTISGENTLPFSWSEKIPDNYQQGRHLVSLPLLIPRYRLRADGVSRVNAVADQENIVQYGHFALN